MERSASRTFQGTIAELRPMSEWFQGLAVAAGLDPDTAWQAEVCLNEAASNIMRYAHADGAPHPITVEIEPVEHGLRMTIIDDGRPFNPAEPRELPVARSIEDMPVGGLGVYLIQSFASEVQYRRDGNRNVLLLTFTGSQSGTDVNDRPSRAGSAHQ
jgi:anti-sigma regulatory factor (Ser/Thr protein kinase)